MTDATRFTTTGVRVPVDLHAAFAEVARRNHRTVSGEIRMLMEDHIARETAVVEEPAA